MEMTTEKWAQVKALFEAALSQEPSHRAAFLAQNSPEDDVRDVTKLLADYEKAGSFLSDPVVNFRPTAPYQVPGDGAGVGSGGSGEGRKRAPKPKRN